MPVKCAERVGKYRVVEAATGQIARTKTGKPRDGGGHATEPECQAQVRAINSAIRKAGR